VITDIDAARLRRAGELFTPDEAARQGVRLVYLNTADVDDPVKALVDLTGGEAYNDVFVFAPVKQLIRQADSVLARDGCLNFFAGPTDHDFLGELNLYRAHYDSTHLIGTSGGNTDDMRESLDMMATRDICPEVMVTHVGGLTSVIDTILNLPGIPGGKKLIYTTLDMPLTAIEDFGQKGKDNPFYADLAKICARNKMQWSLEAEEYVLKKARKV